MENATAAGNRLLLECGRNLVKIADSGAQRGRSYCELDRVTTKGTARSMLIKACRTDQLKTGEALRLNLAVPIALYRLNEGYYATEDTCTHAQASLAAGDVDLEECTVECPYHGSLFDIRTGQVLSFPANKPVMTFVVKVVDDEVFVDVG
jgi:3-phenylpropionate/trans-cinnamate dioxygenase ferredoxin component